MPRLSATGLAPAVTFLRPSSKIASASTVAVVVPSPATSEVLRGDLLHELGAHVLVGVLELDLLGDGDAVLGDGRAAEGLLDDDVAAARAERDLDGAGELAARRRGCARALPGRRRSAWRPCESPNGSRWLLLGRAPSRATTCSSSWPSCWPRRQAWHPWMQPSCRAAVLPNGASSTTARISLASRMRYSLPPSLICVPAYELNRTRLPTFTASGTRVPLSRILPSPTATMRPSVGFSLAESGSRMPPAVLPAASMRSSSTRSLSGLMFDIVPSSGSGAARRVESGWIVRIG